MTAVLVSLFIAATGWGVAPDPPPVPQLTFDEPVDYIAWYDEAASYAANGNALNSYGVFLYDNPQQRLGNLAPDHGTFADRDLRKRMEVPMHWNTDEHLGLAKWAYYLERRFAHVAIEAGKYEYYATRRNPNQAMLCQLNAPLTANARLISQMLVVRAWRADGGSVDPKLLPIALQTSMIMARHLGQGFTIDEQLFANGQHAFVYDQIRRSMRSRFHMVSEWQQVLDMLEKYDAEPLTHDVARSLDFDEAAALQLLQFLCSVLDENGKVQVMPNVNADIFRDYIGIRYPEANSRPAGTDTFVDADPRVLATAVHDYFTGMRALLNDSPVVDINKKVAALEQAAFGAHPELNVLTMPVGLSVQSTFRTEAQRRLVYLFLKMAIDFKKDGTWPKSLDNLQGARMAESRIDPYTGKDMAMRSVSITTVPYSVGPDGVDDGGDETKDIIFWGPVAPESQYNLPPVDMTTNADSNGADLTLPTATPEPPPAP
ncbi:MAG: hypothetical protein H6817_09755 [Phycisphaerales bacterium]|nr:hypothetical protein [Phycisphaerales bacterium]